LQESTWGSPFYADGKVFLGTDSGDLYVFKAGKKLVPPKKVRLSQPLKAPAVAVGGTLYVNTGNFLYAFARD
jgi:outer membrane protein assembly factor BamB